MSQCGSMSTDGQHRSWGDSSMIETWSYAEQHGLSIDEAASRLSAREQRGALRRVSAPLVPPSLERYRPAELQGRESLAVAGKRCGAFVEVAIGPWTEAFRSPTSIYISDDAANLLSSPFTAVFGRSDMYGRPFLPERDQAWALEKALRDLGRRCVSDHSEETMALLLGRYRPRHPRHIAGFRQASDLALGVADWMRWRLTEHETVAVLTY